jgi:hypothetical protein
MTARSGWLSRALFERTLALIYLVAFLSAANQFVPLLGEHGLLPAVRFIDAVPFRASPSLFYLAPYDGAFRAAAWIGVIAALAALSGYPQRLGWAAATATWGLLWVLYLSFVNVGQIFYGFGWETLLLETGFLAIFLGASGTQPSRLLNLLQRWVLFRLMLGAGLIKLRGDACWRDLTCLDVYYETQPIPNALSWWFHWMPHWIHQAGVVFNHVVEVAVPFAYFAPQPIASVAGLVTIFFQLMLIVSGNLSWLNWLTIVLAISTLDDRVLGWLPLERPPLKDPSTLHRGLIAALAAVVAFFSLSPVLNMLSPSQVMNTSFEPFHLVNTYGAFGSITRRRDEIVIEGSPDETVGEATTWREYEFKGKPGDPKRLPSQIAPYHLRLDWLMWFAAMEPPDEHASWFDPLIVKLLQGDAATLGLLRTNPFPDRPPRFIRAELFRYTFTTPDEHKRTGRWWDREPIGLYLPPVSLKNGSMPQ